MSVGTRRARVAIRVEDVERHDSIHALSLTIQLGNMSSTLNMHRIIRNKLKKLTMRLIVPDEFSPRMIIMK